MSTAPSRTKYSSQAPGTRAAPGGSEYSRSRSRNQDWEEWDFRAGTEDAVSSTQHTRRSSRPTKADSRIDERRKSNVTFAAPAPSLAPSDSISKVKSRRPSRASQYPPPAMSNRAPSEARSRRGPGSRVSSANGTAYSGTSGAPLTETNLEAFNEKAPRSIPDDGYGPYPDDVRESVARDSRRESRRYSVAESESKRAPATERRRSTVVASQRDTSDERSGQIPSAAVASSEWSKEQTKASAARSTRRPSAVSRPSYSQDTAASRSRQAPSNASKQLVRRESAASSKRTAPTPSKVIYAGPATAAAGTYAAEEYSSKRSAPTRSKVMYDPPASGADLYGADEPLPESPGPTKSKIMYAATTTGGTEAYAEKTSREVTTSQSRRQSQAPSRRPSVVASQARQSSNSRNVYEQAQQSAEVDVVATSSPSRRPSQPSRISGPVVPRSAYPPDQPRKPAAPWFRERTRVEKWREPSGRMISDEVYLREGRMEPVGAS